MILISTNATIVLQVDIPLVLEDLIVMIVQQTSTQLSVAAPSARNVIRAIVLLQDQQHVLNSNVQDSI
jgi:hypothetical protein